MKTETTHTPGPWKLLDGAIVSAELNGYGNFIVVEMPSRSGHGIGVEEKANARLIAAAPDMLKVLEEVSVYLDCCAEEQDETNPDDSYDLSREVRAAIAKGKGVKHENHRI